MGCSVSDEWLGTFVPIVVYMGFYVLLGSFENYRLHSRKEEDVKNLVSKKTVVKGVLLQQIIQAVVAIFLFTVTGKDCGVATDSQPSLVVLARQFLVAMFVLDTWQYFMHHNKFLYQYIHSQHHRLVVPYAFGALYNHPLEGLLLDTIGGSLSFLLFGMSPRASIFFFSFATIKAVDDHCGVDYGFPVIYSIYYVETTLLIMISIISFMAANKTFRSLSLLNGIEFSELTELTCLTHL